MCMPKVQEHVALTHVHVEHPVSNAAFAPNPAFVPHSKDFHLIMKRGYEDLCSYDLKQGGLAYSQYSNSYQICSKGLS